MIAHVESSRTGASFIGKHEANNPRQMLIRILEDNSGASKEVLFSLFRLCLEEDEGFQRAVDWYFFINMFEYAVTSRNRRLDPTVKAEARMKQAEMVESIKSQIVMLDLTMTNGKAMRDCTGAEMAKFGNRFQKIAERVGKTKLVGDVLDEAQVVEIMK